MKNGLQWLKTVGCIDTKAENMIRRLVRGNRKFLVLGNTGSGKDTLADALYACLMDSGKNAARLPCLEGKTFTAVRATREWKTISAMLNHDVPSVTSVGYANSSGFNYYIPELPALGRYFDVVFDIRKMSGGKRVLCQILLTRGSRTRCVYRNPAIASHSDISSIAA